MAEDDNFDIDIYGDGGGYNGNEGSDYKADEPELILDPQDHNQNGGGQDASAGQKPTAESGGANGEQVTTTDTAHQPQHQFPPSQGVKRKEHDDRPSDPDAMSALLISDLFWWTTDDDIRGFVRDAQCEDELKDVTFSEHKVNGKSKGQAFLEFTSLQASTATKRQFESFNEAGETNRRHMVTYTTPFPNPFRTLPKDAPMRKDHQARGSGGFHSPNQNMNFGGMNNMGGGFRGGGRGGFHHRGGGGMGNNMGGFGGPNRPFPNPMGGGGFQGGPGGGPMGFQGNPMGGMQSMGNFGFNNRGNMMGGMRGGMRGRGGGGPGGGGGMPTPNMMGMPGMAGPMGGMGGMGMNPMGAGGMNPMMGGMGGNMGMQGGFQGPNPGFNQGFFPGGQGGVGDGSWNPHGAKRSRQE